MAMRRAGRPALAILTTVFLALGCAPETDEEAAAPPDTVVRESGSEAARDFCRQQVRERLGIPRERIAFQEDGLVRSRGSERFQSDGRARVLAPDGRTTEAVYQFDCLVRDVAGVGWTEEELHLRQERRQGRDIDD